MSGGTLRAFDGRGRAGGTAGIGGKVVTTEGDEQMHSSVWKIWCHFVLRAYVVGVLAAHATRVGAVCVRKFRGYRLVGMPGLALVCAFLLIDRPDAPELTRIAAADSTPHGPMISGVLTLPEFESNTHMQQARKFARKLVIGFSLKPATAVEFSDWIIEASARQRLQPELIASLVFAESSFRKSVQSHVGAIGPAQVRPHYWGEFCGQNDLYDPEQNIYCGTQILGLLLERCAGDQVCALSAYNIGMNSNRRAAGLRYVAKIDLHMQRLQGGSL